MAKKQIGDQYLLNGIITQIKYINNDQYYLVPTEDYDEGIFKGVVMGVIDVTNRSKEGKKAYRIVCKKASK